VIAHVAVVGKGRRAIDYDI
jgi:hypothetical protein